MIKTSFSRLLAAAFTLTLFTGAADAAMTFRLMERGGERWIAAEGRIELSTPRRFGEFVEANRLWGTRIPVRLNSPGGNLMGGLELGVKIFEQRFPTQVVSGARCFSACVWTFMAGIGREAAPRTLGIHRFFNVANPTPNGLTRSGRAQQRAEQEISYMLQRYVRYLCIDSLVVDASMRIPPNQIYLLTASDLQQLRVNTGLPGQRAAAAAPSRGAGPMQPARPRRETRATAPAAAPSPAPVQRGERFGGAGN